MESYKGKHPNVILQSAHVGDHTHSHTQNTCTNAHIYHASKKGKEEGRKKHRSPNRAQALRSQGMHTGAQGQVRFQTVSNKVLKAHNENQAQHSVPH